MKSVKWLNYAWSFNLIYPYKVEPWQDICWEWRSMLDLKIKNTKVLTLVKLSVTSSEYFRFSNFYQSWRFKYLGKIRLGFNLSLNLIYDLSFRIKAASYFPQSWVHYTGLIFYLVDFHGRNWRIPGFDENKTQYWAWFYIETNQRPNLKNLSGGLNLSCGSNMVGFT